MRAGALSTAVIVLCAACGSPSPGTSNPAEPAKPAPAPQASDSALPEAVRVAFNKAAPNATITDVVDAKDGVVIRYVDDAGNWEMAFDRTGKALGAKKEYIGCTSDLPAQLKAVWKLPAAHQVVPIRCAKLGPDGTFAAWAFVDHDESTAKLRRAVVSADGNRVVAVYADDNGNVDEDTAPWRRGEGFQGSLSAIDFDGDGTPEIAEVEMVAKGGSATGSLRVFQIAGDRLRLVFSEQIYSYENPDQEDESEASATTCEASWRAVPGPTQSSLVLEIEGTVKQGPQAPGADAKDCPRGIKRYRLAGGEFKAEG